MDRNEIMNLIEQIKVLFSKSKLQECIEMINKIQFDQIQSSKIRNQQHFLQIIIIISQQCLIVLIIIKIDEDEDKNIKQVDFEQKSIIQLYLGLSYYEQGKLQQGQECFEDLIKQRNEKKMNKIDELDIIITVLYLAQLYDEQQSKAIKYNDKLLLQLNQFQSQYKLTNDHLNNQQNLSSNYHNLTHYHIYALGLGMYTFINQNNHNSSNIYLLNHAFIHSLNIFIDQNNQNRIHQQQSQSNNKKNGKNNKNNNKNDSNNNNSNKNNHIDMSILNQNTKQNSINFLKYAQNFNKSYQQHIMNLIGWMYFEIKMYEDSIQQYVLISNSCDFPGVSNNLAILYEIQRNYKSAEYFYSKAEIYSQNNPIILTNIAKFYQRNDNKPNYRELAIQYYNKAIESNPQYEKTYTSYAQYLFTYSNDYTNSRKILQQGLNTCESKINILSLLLDIEVQCNEFQKAKQCLKEINKINFNNDGYYDYKFGSQMFDYGQYTDSLKYLEIALKKDLPSDLIELTLKKIGYCYFNQGNFKESLKNHLQACNLEEVEYLQDSLEHVGYLLSNMNDIEVEDKTMILNNMHGPFEMRISQLIPTIKFQTCLEEFLKYKMNAYNTCLSLVVYESHCTSHLTFQNNHSHWDLYFD